ncbi:MAG TPA: YciI family protein [Puia sp.]|jgi:hypothetical protein
MKEFLLLFRRDASQMGELSPGEMQAAIKPWQDWMGSLAAQDKLAGSGNRLDSDGRVLRGNTVTNGPYVEVKESIGGYIMVRAKDIDEAAGLAKGCPILKSGGNVEVRPVVSTD